MLLVDLGGYRTDDCVAELVVKCLFSEDVQLAEVLVLGVNFDLFELGEGLLGLRGYTGVVEPVEVGTNNRGVIFTEVDLTIATLLPASRDGGFEEFRAFGEDRVVDDEEFLIVGANRDLDSTGGDSAAVSACLDGELNSGVLPPSLRRSIFPCHARCVSPPV